jgi:hypothetical protein
MSSSKRVSGGLTTAARLAMIADRAASVQEGVRFARGEPGEEPLAELQESVELLAGIVHDLAREVARGAKT